MKKYFALLLALVMYLSLFACGKKEDGGTASFSVMANGLRGLYGTDVLLAAANSFTGSVRQADYTTQNDLQLH